MMELHGKGDNARNVHCPLFRCSSSARISQELCRRCSDWKKSTAQQCQDGRPSSRLPTKQAQSARLNGCSRQCVSRAMQFLLQDCQRGEPKGRRRGVAVDGVSGVQCSCSARTFQEASDGEAYWGQFTACQYWGCSSSARIASKASPKGEGEVIRSTA